MFAANAGQNTIAKNRDNSKSHPRLALITIVRIDSLQNKFYKYL
jgi:hypothetical protein